MRPAVTYGAVLAIGLAALVVIPASSSPAAAEGPTRLSLTTDYLFKRVDVAQTPFGGHWLLLDIALGKAGRGRGLLTIDPNTQRHNGFGDPGVATEIATSSVDIMLEAVKLADPTRKGRQLYEIKGKGLKGRLFLVVSPRDAGPHRLLIGDNDGSVRYVIPLKEQVGLVRMLAVPPAADEPAASGAPADVQTVVQGNTAFALDLYARLREREGNLFYSPYSISTALAMTYAGARGETEAQMARVLHFTLGQQLLHPAFGSLRGEIQGAGQKRKYQLQTANRLWGQKGYGFLPHFLKTTETYYGAGLKEVDFVRATEEARRMINGWVEEQTNDKIRELLKPGLVTPNTRLVLTNAIYFKAAWMLPFNARQTRDEDFLLADGNKVKAKLMHGRRHANYFKGDTFVAVELPYERHDLSMIILLPNQADGLPALEQRFTMANLKQWLGKLSDHDVDVTLPKFKLTSEFLLEGVLSKMGMPIAFGTGADFSGMTTRDKLYISRVVHKAFVDVNEAGTEAAAATAVLMERAAPISPRATFHADHPFVYLIRDNRTGSILFVGRVTDPSTDAQTGKG
jgi:serpin B